MEKKLYKNNISSLTISSLNFGILLELEKVNYIINKSKPFDPLLNLSKDIEDIKNILKSNSQNILNFLYFNMDYVERILYVEDEIIYFDYDNKNQNFYLKINQDEIEIKEKNDMVFLFYISLLIKYNKNIVNFSFSFGFINRINSLNKIEVYNLYKNILISKIILELINFYKRDQIFKEENNKEINEKLNEIEKDNNNIIENCSNDFKKQLGLKITLKELKNIDLIYAEIINILLKSKDYDIIKQLCLENINITKTMFNEISKILSLSSNIKNEYRLKTLDDLIDPTKIDFYYILFKYILKNSIYIYYIDFLNETRKNIIKIIHLNQNQLKNLSNNNKEKLDYNFKEKVKYIIKFFTNSEYYVKYININSKLNDESIIPKFEIIKVLDQSLDKKNKENQSSQNIIKSIISDSTLKKFYNDGLIPQENNKSTSDSSRFSIKNEMKNEFLNKVKFALQRSTITLIINKEKKIEYKDIVYEKGAIAYEELINPFKENPEQKFDDDKDKEFQNYKKLIKFLDKIKEITNKSISESNLSNLEQELRIEIKLQRDINQSNDDYINSEYILEKSFSKLDKYQDKDVLNNDNYRYFILFSTKIINNPQISSIQKNSSIIGNGSSTNKNEKDIIDKINELYKYRFIIFKKVIGKHRQIAEKIREVNNGLFVSDGYNEIFMYNTDYEKQNGNYNFENYYSFFIEENDVLISQKNIFRFLSKCDDNNSSIKTEFSCRNLFNLKNHTLIICDENKVYCSYNLKDFATTKQNFVLYEKAYRGGIKINDDLLAITSNNILSKGENKLIFFHQISKLFLGEFEVKDYSFILSENNCALMKIPKQENDKLLLVACKKYRKKDENGIYY